MNWNWRDWLSFGRPLGSLVGFDALVVDTHNYLDADVKPEGSAMFDDGLWLDEEDINDEDLKKLDEETEADEDRYSTDERHLWMRPALVGLGDWLEASSGDDDTELAKLRPDTGWPRLVDLRTGRSC